MLVTVLTAVGVTLFVAAAVAIWAFGMWDYVTGRAARQQQATELLLRGPEAWGMPTDRHRAGSQDRQDASESKASGRQ
jgi:hypothetical protein